jgi:hypothetical protein
MDNAPMNDNSSMALGSTTTWHLSDKRSTHISARARSAVGTTVT